MGNSLSPKTPVYDLVVTQRMCLSARQRPCRVSGYLGTLVTCVCGEDQTQVGYGSPWVFAQWGHCFWQVRLGKCLGLCHWESLGDQCQRLANTQVSQFKVPSVKCGPVKRMNVFAIRAFPLHWRKT